MIDLIRELHHFLSTDPLSIEDVIARVGPIADDPGGFIPIELQPVLPGVRAAKLARNPTTGLPYVLTIELAPTAQLTIADLRTAFGDYQRVLTDRGRPPEIIFHPPASDSLWKVAILATLQSTSPPLDDQQIGSLSFRRERRS